ncbi:peroxiredoxin [Lacipirellula sp.]|uniref:peroxiredoxin n=1 Tax=Lacipirellula sp. TaxID=2691419 RepID=UPI003D0EBB44
MLRFLSLTLCAALLAATAMTAYADETKPVDLKVGDKAPKFAGDNDEGKAWKSDDHVGKKIIVLYFYPKDMTPGCTKQACTYRDMQKDFTGKDVEIIGVSGDSVESHQNFKSEHELNFTLLADPKGEIAKAFGVKLLSNSPDSIVTSRWTFIIDDEGKIAYKNDKVDAAKDPETVLKVIEELEAKGG